MDKLSKALVKLSAKEKEKIKNILKQLTAKNFRGLNMVKLKGRDDVYRVRKGDLRIIYRIDRDKIFILTIEKRSEKTYRDF